MTPNTNPINPLSKQEKQWILQRRVERLTDNKEVQIYPMGAERYLSSALFQRQPDRFPIKEQIVNKKVLVIPGYGNNGFLFAQAGAKSVKVIDKDPVTMAWMRAFKRYYHFKEHVDFPSVGELLTALTCWHPPVLQLPSGSFYHKLLWALSPNGLRRIYIHYLVRLVQMAVQSHADADLELDREIHFYTGTIEEVVREQPHFDVVYVPYLLGVKNGIEKEEDIVCFLFHLINLAPDAPIMVTPSRNTKEFYILGQRYFTTTKYSTIQSIPQLKSNIRLEDRDWFRTQGLVIF